MTPAKEDTVMKLETFSYLPKMTTEQLAKQIQYVLKQGLIPAVEYVREPLPNDHYWSMWKLPLFDARAAEDVLAEVQACKSAHPDCYVRLIGYDRYRQSQAVSFVVHRP
jgi:ribulose-bisphosphate carboxylase small chain